MAEVRCPFCGREVIRGKYCTFCGNPLKGARPEKGGSQARKTDDERWDPETVYRQSRARVILTGFLLFVLAASAALIILVNRKPAQKEPEIWIPGSGLPASSLTVTYGMTGGMTLDEICEAMEKYGFVRLGDRYTHADAIYQMFNETEIFDCETEYSLAAKWKNGQQAILHYFTEKPGNYTLDMSGWVLTRIRMGCTILYGEPTRHEGYPDAWIWSVGEGTLVLRYIVQGEVELQYCIEGNGELPGGIANERTGAFPKVL